MRKNLLSDTAIAAISTPGSERMVRWYAERLTGQHNRRICFISSAAPGIRETSTLAGTTHPESIPGAIRQLSKAESIGMIVSEWSKTNAYMQSLLHLADELSVPAVFIRHDDFVPIERVVVATAGGPNVLELMWIAKEIAVAYDVPVRILHCHRTEPGIDLDNADSEQPSLETMGARLFGMNATVETGAGEDFTRCVASYLRKKDLLVLGAPSPLRRTMSFTDSIPETVARTITTPMILLSSPQKHGVDLRRLFWGGLIKTGVCFSDKKDAISGLIENLAHHNQLPRASMSDILDRALRREDVMPTAVDCETAFPHVTLGRFHGLAATMAVCPDGVAFGSMDGQPTRFLYLMVTPDALYDDYLTTLARIARRMILSKVRKALLTCKTSAQVLDILEPREITPGIIESQSRVFSGANERSASTSTQARSMRDIDQ